MIAVTAIPNGPGTAYDLCVASKEEPVDTYVEYDSYTIECSECGPLGVVDADLQHDFCMAHFQLHERKNR